MNSKTKNSSEKISVETLGLISWYATGWLSASDRAYVKQQLDAHPELKKYLKDEQQIIHLINEDETLLDLSALESTDKRLKGVMSRLDSIPQENNSFEHMRPDTFASDSLGSRTSAYFRSLITEKSSTFKYAGFAGMAVFAALLIAFMAPILAPLTEDKNNHTFHPATVRTAETSKQSTTTELLVGVNGELQNNWLDSFLRKNNANMTRIPGKDGLYRIKFDKKLDAAEIESLLNQLNSQKETIWFSGEAF